jgi:hypothetical protein
MLQHHPFGPMGGQVKEPTQTGDALFVEAAELTNTMA